MAVLLDVKRVMFCRITPVLAVLLFVGYAAAQSRTTVGAASGGSPFAPLAGSWSGAGTIDLAYDVLEEQNKLQLNLHCASESYNFARGLTPRPCDRTA
jgi:hypothetical protein